MKGKRGLGKYPNEFNRKHLRKHGKKEFWKAYRRELKSDRSKQYDAE